VSGIYYPLADILQAAGCQVGVNSINAGWETRSRSSGGFPSPPLAVFWHHTASKTSVDNDLTWQCHTCQDKPVGNMLIDRTGMIWPVAAGASNCAGKGGPASFSRGTIPQDTGNTRGFQIEVANNGTGEPWPQVQIDAYFRASNALNAYVGNQPTDVITHNVWAPTRKIDPATASAVQGPWVPRSSTSSGTWNLDDIKAECAARAAKPGPRPPTGDDDEVFVQFAYSVNPQLGPGEVFAIYSNGTKIWQINDGTLDRARDLAAIDGKDNNIYEYPDMTLFGALGMVPAGMNAPGHDAWGNRVQ